MLKNNKYFQVLQPQSQREEGHAKPNVHSLPNSHEVGEIGFIPQPRQG